MPITNNKLTLQLFGLLMIIIIVALFGYMLRYFGPANFDEPLLLWFRVSSDTNQLAGPQWTSSFWSGISWMGDKTPRIVVAAATIAALLLFRRWQSALFTAVILSSGVALTVFLKHLIVRPRPQLVSHLDHVSLQSFPSGHTLNSTLFYLTAAFVIAPLLPKQNLRYLLYALAIILSLAIGVSRIALGVHWPSDVIASWIIATSWLSFWVLLAGYCWPKNKV